MSNLDYNMSFSTFCAKSNLKLIRDFVSSNLRQNHVQDKDCHMITLAVDEICTNSIIHGNRENIKNCVDVMIKVNPVEVIIEIVDKGISFDYTKFKEKSLDQLVKEKSKGSMGIMLVKRIMDKIEYVNESNKNVCRMVKTISVM
ncbi:MAG: ATP-binding protein [Cytophagales bacterium]|nr:ATP-binding protein [Cytophagales bacterium]